jgi:hypothetical protein
MDEAVREKLLQILEAKMKEHAPRAAQEKNQQAADYFAGRIDGLNDAYRLLSSGEIET